MTEDIREQDLNKTETYGVKLPTGTKQRLIQLIDASGQTAKDFFEQMITSFEASKLTQEADDLVAREIQQVEHHQNRVKEILVGLVKAMTDQKELFATNTQELQEKHAGVVANLNDQVLQFKTQAKELEDENKELKEHAAKTVERNIELEENHRTFTKTIALLETNVEELRGQVQGYEELKKDYSTLGVEANRFQAEVERLQTQLEAQASQHQSEVNNLTERLETLKISHEQQIEGLKTAQVKEVDQLKTGHEKDLAAAKIEMDLACQKIIRNLEKEHKAELDKLREKYEERIEKLLEKVGQQPIIKKNQDDK